MNSTAFHLSALNKFQEKIEEILLCKHVIGKSLIFFFPITATVSAACMTEAVNKLGPTPLDGSVFPS